MERSLALLALLLTTSLATAGEPWQQPGIPLFPLSALPPAPESHGASVAAAEFASAEANCPPEDGKRGFLKSDRAFPGFIGPISNPILAKDPRALTEFRFLFVDDYLPTGPAGNPLRGGDFQAYGFQVRAALTDRLSFIADKDGFASIHPHVGGSRTGLLNVAMGLKYALVRDVEHQFLVVGGVQYEPQSGYANVFQNLGDTMTGFVTIGKEFGCYHAIVNSGYQQALDRNLNSSFTYTSLHFDRQYFGWLYPLTEVNWFHYTEGGHHGLPAPLGEGDGLLNLGTSGIAGTNLVTVAGGLKAIVNQHMDTGIAYEYPVSNRRDLINSRILFEMIFRY